MVAQSTRWPRANEPFYVGQHVRVIKFGKFYGATGGVEAVGAHRIKVVHRGPLPWTRWFDREDVAEVVS